MKSLYYEIKHCFNKVSIFALLLFLLVVFLHSIIYLSIQCRTILPDGTLVEGLSSHRAFSEASKELKGVLDDEYLQKLKKTYASSYEKKYLDIDKGFLGTGGLMKYINTNYLLNKPKSRFNATNGNEYMEIDFPYLENVDTFYAAYKETLVEVEVQAHEATGFRPYTDEEIKQIKDIVNNIQLPLRLDNTMWMSSTRNYLYLEYFIFTLVLCISFSSIFSRDGINPVSDIALASKQGKNKYICRRFIAGLVAAAIMYLIYFVFLSLIHGSVYGFRGWNASIQSKSNFNVLNMTAGKVFLLECLGGLIGTLAVTSIVLLVSIIIKRTKASLLVSAGLVYFLNNQLKGYSILRFTNPLFFKTDSMETLISLFGRIVPYLVLIILLGILYISICFILVRLLGKRYRWLK